MKHKKILIIDDEPDVIAYLMTLLQANGYETFFDTNVKNGFELLHSVNPDLICLDIMMPQETGLSFYKRLRMSQEFNQIPVIIISGAIESGNFDFRTYIKDDSISAPEAYMEKPINIDAFIHKVYQLLEDKK